jgi:hypothetical protein
MIGQIKSHILSPSNSESNNFKDKLCNDLEDPEKLPFVAPLRIKVHPEVSTPQPVSQQNTYQPSTSLTLDETPQLWESQLKTPALNVKSEVIKDFRDGFELAKYINMYRNSSELMYSK